MKKEKSSYFVPVAMELLDFARVKRTKYSATRASELLIRISRDLPRLGVESFVRASIDGSLGVFDKKDIAYALFLVSVLPYSILSKFNISVLIKDTVISVLEELLRRL